MLQGLKLTLAPLAWQFMKASIRMDELPSQYLTQVEPLIFSCLHRDILPAIMHVRPARPALLVSQSPDGDILVRTLGQANYLFVRGATGENGSRAFVELARQLEAGNSIGVAVDGPKGPFGSIQEGVLQLARLTGAPILPLVAKVNRAKVLATWDRTVVPYPFSRVRFEHGPMLRVDRAAGHTEIQHCKGRLRDFFQIRGEAS